jgi:hypothetical protein
MNTMKENHVQNRTNKSTVQGENSAEYCSYFGCFPLAVEIFNSITNWGRKPVKYSIPQSFKSVHSRLEVARFSLKPVDCNI